MKIKSATPCCLVLFSVCAFAFFSSIAADADWPEYRGPWQNGFAAAPGKSAGIPTHWSETENVKWKTATPLRGLSTPVVQGDQVWLTTATEDGHDFFAICVDAKSGQIKFNEKIFHSDNPEPLANAMNSYASCSPAIEPGCVYLHFGSYGTACLDTSSAKVIWKRDDLPCQHFRGPGSSLILFKDFLILTMDGIDVQYLAALDKKTGKTIWKTDRTTEWNDLNADGKPQGGGDFRKAYSTPLVIEANGKPQMISAGSKGAFSYDPLTGREIWKIRYAGFSLASRPVFGKGLSFISTGNGKAEFLAVRVDGQGDVTDTNIVWRVNRGVPRLSSPLLVDDLIYMIADSGIATCIEAATGQQIWQERLSGEYAASPIYDGGNVFCFGQNGTATVLKAGRTFEIVATNKLDSGFFASPAVSGKALFLRTKTHLYRIESKT